MRSCCWRVQCVGYEFLCSGREGCYVLWGHAGLGGMRYGVNVSIFTVRYSVCICLWVLPGNEPWLSWASHYLPWDWGFFQRAITIRSPAHLRVHLRMAEVVIQNPEGGGILVRPERSGPSPPFPERLLSAYFCSP